MVDVALDVFEASLHHDGLYISAQPNQSYNELLPGLRPVGPQPWRDMAMSPRQGTAFVTTFVTTRKGFCYLTVKVGRKNFSIMESIQIWGQPHISARIPASLAYNPSWRTAPMQMTVPLVVCEGDGHEETITEVVILEKTCQQIEQVGLTLAEAKTLLQRLQQHLVEQQAATFAAMRTHCQACGALLSTKGHHAHLPDALWDHQADQSTALLLPVYSS
jgi:hypothetical protein